MKSRKSKTLGFSDLKKYLRHQHPMVYLDRVIDHEPGKFLEAILSVSGNLDCIAGHFPGRGIYPGTNLLQGFAQCAIILYQIDNPPLKENELTLITRADSRFLKVVVPGDQVVLRTNLERSVNGLFMFKGTATVDNQKVAAFRVSLIRANESELGDPLW